MKCLTIHLHINAFCKNCSLHCKSLLKFYLLIIEHYLLFKNSKQIISTCNNYILMINISYNFGCKILSKVNNFLICIQKFSIEEN